MEQQHYKSDFVKQFRVKPETKERLRALANFYGWPMSTYSSVRLTEAVNREWLELNGLKAQQEQAEK